VEVCCRTQDGRIVFVAVPLCQLTGGRAPAVPPVSAAIVPAEDADGRPAERFLIARRALRDNDNLFGPRDVIPLAMRQLAQMRDLSRSLRGDDGRELLLPQIQFADLLGWLYQDSCEYDSAQRWLDRALRWAHALGDDSCVAFVLARRSQLACDTRDAVTAIAAAGAAMRLAGRYSLTGAAAATYGAHGHALAGDAVASSRLYDRARETLRRGGTDAPADRTTRWATFLDTAYIDVYHAHSLAVLGQHSAAAVRFEAAIGALRPGYHRDRGVYLAREARARANAGEYDRAAQLAVRALTIGAETGSARIFAELAAVRDGAMASWDSPDAAWFRDRLATVGR
jgi:tetratricopeptide (TPR) repeat protein